MKLSQNIIKISLGIAIFVAYVSLIFLIKGLTIYSTNEYVTDTNLVILLFSFVISITIANNFLNRIK